MLGILSLFLWGAEEETFILVKNKRSGELSEWLRWSLVCLGRLKPELKFSTAPHTPSHNNRD
jgi:hypothetical protein